MKRHVTEQVEYIAEDHSLELCQRHQLKEGNCTHLAPAPPVAFCLLLQNKVWPFSQNQGNAKARSV